MKLVISKKSVRKNLYIPTTMPELTKSQKRNLRRARKRKERRKRREQEKKNRREWDHKIYDLTEEIGRKEDACFAAAVDEGPWCALELLMLHVYLQMVAFARDPRPFLEALNEQEGSCFKIGYMHTKGYTRPHTWAYLGTDQKVSSSENLNVTFDCVWDRKDANAVSWRMARTCVEKNFCSFYTALIIYFGRRPSEDQHLASHIAKLVAMISRYYADVTLTRPPTRPAKQGIMNFHCTGGYIPDSAMEKLIRR